MVSYNVDAPLSETVTFLQRFEAELDAELKRLVTISSEAACLTVARSLTLKPCPDGAPSMTLTHNASFSLSGSMALAQAVSEYLEALRKEFDACIPSGQTLAIDILLKKRENAPGQSGSNAKQTDQTPAYTPVKPKYSWEQVILPEQTRTDIMDALGVILRKELIYETWGFGRVDPVPRSILNFYGPPGTGKTMAAHALASHLGKTLLAMNYADVESKYVGDAPKNLMKAFQTADATDSVLFFDEADSFLGRRIQNVTQGADQALNSLRSQMLMLLEEHEGVVVFATNLVTNFDHAFESRILKQVRFELPDMEARKAIIASKIPPELPMKAPLSDEDVAALAEICDGMSGREIKSAVLETILRKASEEGESALFTAEDFTEAFRHKAEAMKQLHEEGKKEKEQKILSALSRMEPQSAPPKRRSRRRRRNPAK